MAAVECAAVVGRRTADHDAGDRLPAWRSGGPDPERKLRSPDSA